jgi:hypothetical protein
LAPVGSMAVAATAAGATVAATDNTVPDKRTFACRV